MPVSVERIRADIEAIGRCTATPGNGASRPTFSKEWGRACDYVIAQAKSAGCEVYRDAAGNVRARPAELGWETPAWLCGSHIDTVPHGGDYDGVTGIVVALELLRAARESGQSAYPLELIIFAEEEGPTFGLGMLGSRAWVGDLDAAKLASLKNAGGQNYFEAGKPFGVEADKLAADRFDPSRYFGLLEVHIEQGPGMWRRDQRLAVVRAIAGRRQLAVVVTGEANHAGATSMDDRRDALAAAAEMVVRIEETVKTVSASAVATVGRMNVSPNAVNVIPDRVEFTIDFRAEADSELAAGLLKITGAIHGVANSRGVSVDLRETEAIGAKLMSPTLVNRLIAAVGVPLPVTISGALHDSAVMAPHLPTVMLFVPSRGGISHNPAEFSRVEDIASATELLQKVIARPGIEQLSAMPLSAFVRHVGGVFEHSPWIAERAFAGRPFASVVDLHAKMKQTVASATPEEQLGLIRAHPDLVGRLAREGKLTRESTAEQSAAGLAALSPAEVSAFETYNASYREKFGFPFVICARENKKEAILAAFPRRLENSRDAEIATALEEIYKIARLRLADAIWEP